MTPGDNNADESAGTASRRSSGSGGGLGAIKLLTEELQLDIVPQKLQRQFSLNIPSASVSGQPVHGVGGSGAYNARGYMQSHASATMIEGVRERWEKSQVKWGQPFQSHNNNDEENDPEADQSASIPLQGALDDFAPMHSESTPTTFTSASGSSAFFNEADEPLAHRTRADKFEVKFADGFLGLEFVADEARRQVVVKSVQMGSWSKNIMQIPPGMAVTRGLIVDAVDGCSVVGVAPGNVLDLLQYTPRPFMVRFRKCEFSWVVCKLCECKVDAWSLDDHTNYCVMSKRIELEADQINNTLSIVAASIKTTLEADSLRACFHPEDLHFYHALRVIAIQVSCVLSSVPMPCLYAHISLYLLSFRPLPVMLRTSSPLPCAQG